MKDVVNIDLEKQKSQAMAYSRNDWINKLEDKIVGVLGEYAKQKYADLVGFKGHCWTPEVERLIKQVEKHISEFKIKSKCDRQKALYEAVNQSFSNQLKVTQARNKFADISEEYSRKIGSTSYGAGDLIKELFKLYLPSEIKIKYPEQ